MDYKSKMYSKVSELANKYKFTAAMLGGTNPDLADIVIHIDDYCMIGLKLNPSSSTKPFNLYPYGIDVDFDELNDYLQGHKWGQEIVTDAGQETI